jgi:hypothetical protein
VTNGLRDNTDSLEAKAESSKAGVVKAGEWTKFTFPFKLYFDQVKTSDIVNLNFGFNINHGKGTICIDDVAFE